MPTTNLTYKKWLQQKNLTSTKQNATRWARAAGRPAPVRRNRPPIPTQIPGPRTPEYMGYAGAVDPSFGGTPLSLPADAGLVWTGAVNPDLQEIARGGYGQLTPKRRAGGGWDVYGVPLDPTPQWGKDYLSSLRQREKSHLAYADQTVAPWMQRVLGGWQGANNAAQTGLANIMGQANQMAANAVPPGPFPGGMTGAGSGAGLIEDLAGQRTAEGQAAANTQLGAYNAAMGQLNVGSTAAAHQAAFDQSRLRIPGDYEKMRMDFSARLGEITEGIKENQRQREMQRQSLLEQRREWGMTFAEQKRSARAQEAIQRRALDWEQSPENPSNMPAAGEDTQHRSLEQIRQDLNKGERLVSQGRGYDSQAAGRRATRNNPNVQWERAEDGKWYGIFTPGGVESSSSDGSSTGSGDYSKRLREYPLDQYTQGRFRDPRAGESGRQQVEGPKSWQWIANDLFNRQKFKGADVWSMVWPSIKEMPGTLTDGNGKFVRGDKYNAAKLIVQRWFQSMTGKNSEKVKKISKVTGWGDDQVKFIITNGKPGSFFG